MNALILEDEYIASRRLQKLISELDSEIEIIKIVTSIQETVEYLNETERQPDILFVDIHVSDGNSMELFNLVDVRSKVIFTTAYNEYAISAFRQNATDYILKPVKKEELSEAIDRVKTFKQNEKNSLVDEKYKSRFLIRFGAKMYTVKTSEIAYIYSKNKISFFYTYDGLRIPSDYKLQDLEEMLNPLYFFRANRQFLIHIDSIVNIKTHDASRLKISLNPHLDKEFVVSTEKTKLFKKWIQK